MNVRAGMAWGTSLLLCGVLSVALSRRIDLMRGFPGETKEGNAAGSLLAEISRRPALALGFRNFLGDLVWLEAVQVSGNPKMTSSEYGRLYSLLIVATNYDPRFDIPCLVGGLVLGESQAHAREALDILERGRVQHPDDWRFPFYIGYTHYFSLGNPLDGGRAIAAAARLRGSPAYLARLASRMLSEGGDPGTAISLLTAMISEETDERRKVILARRLGEVVVERDIQALERSVGEFRRRTGGPPSALSDLVGAGLIAEMPREPHGGRYVLLPGGTVASDRMARRLKVFKK